MHMGWTWHTAGVYGRHVILVICKYSHKYTMLSHNGLHMCGPFWVNCVFEHTYSRILHVDSGIYAAIDYAYYSIYAMVLHNRLHICYVCQLYDGIYAVIDFDLRWKTSSFVAHMLCMSVVWWHICDTVCTQCVTYMLSHMYWSQTVKKVHCSVVASLLLHDTDWAYVVAYMPPSMLANGHICTMNFASRKSIYALATTICSI
jgi:hypothetical protein